MWQTECCVINSFLVPTLGAQGWDCVGTVRTQHMTGIMYGRQQDRQEKEKAWMLSCLRVPSPAWTPNNKVSCDFKQLKEQFLMFFHLDFHFLDISRNTTCFFCIKSLIRMTLFPFLWDNNRDNSQVDRLNDLHFSFNAGSVPAAYVMGELSEATHAARRCASCLGGSAFPKGMSHWRSYRCSTPGIGF